VFGGGTLNAPLVNYYEHGTFLTLNHAHTALLGAFGLLGIGLIYFCLRAMAGERAICRSLARSELPLVIRPLSPAISLARSWCGSCLKAPPAAVLSASLSGRRSSRSKASRSCERLRDLARRAPQQPTKVNLIG
jgi:hypothetical protein